MARVEITLSISDSVAANNDWAVAKATRLVASEISRGNLSGTKVIKRWSLFLFPRRKFVSNLKWERKRIETN